MKIPVKDVFHITSLGLPSDARMITPMRRGLMGWAKADRRTASRSCLSNNMVYTLKDPLK
jgi:hypothetical protein